MTIEYNSNETNNWHNMKLCSSLRAFFDIEKMSLAPAGSTLDYFRYEGTLYIIRGKVQNAGLITRCASAATWLLWREARIDPPTIFRRPFHTTSTCCHHHHDLLRRPPHLRPPGRLVHDGSPLRFVRGRGRCRRSGIAVRPANRRLHHRRCPRRFHGVRVAGREEGEDTTCHVCDRYT